MHTTKNPSPSSSPYLAPQRVNSPTSVTPPTSARSPASISRSAPAPTLHRCSTASPTTHVMHHSGATSSPANWRRLHRRLRGDLLRQRHLLLASRSQRPRHRRCRSDPVQPSGRAHGNARPHGLQDGRGLTITDGPLSSTVPRLERCRWRCSVVRAGRLGASSAGSVSRGRRRPFRCSGRGWGWERGWMVSSQGPR